MPRHLGRTWECPRCGWTEYQRLAIAVKHPCPKKNKYVQLSPLEDKP